MLMGSFINPRTTGLGSASASRDASKQGIRHAAVSFLICSYIFRRYDGFSDRGGFRTSFVFTYAASRKTLILWRSLRDSNPCYSLERAVQSQPVARRRTVRSFSFDYIRPSSLTASTDTAISLALVRWLDSA